MSVHHAIRLNHGVADPRTNKHDLHEGYYLEAVAFHCQSKRLMIQIIVFLEILISCFLRSERYASFSGRTSQAGAPETAALLGWRTDGKSAGWRRVCRMSRPLV